MATLINVSELYLRVSTGTCKGVPLLYRPLVLCNSHILLKPETADLSKKWHFFVLYVLYDYYTKSLEGRRVYYYTLPLS